MHMLHCLSRGSAMNIPNMNKLLKVGVVSDGKLILGDT